MTITLNSEEKHQHPFQAPTFSHSFAATFDPRLGLFLDPSGPRCQTLNSFKVFLRYRVDEHRSGETLADTQPRAPLTQTHKNPGVRPSRRRRRSKPGRRVRICVLYYKTASKRRGTELCCGFLRAPLKTPTGRLRRSTLSAETDRSRRKKNTPAQVEARAGAAVSHRC